MTPEKEKLLKDLWDVCIAANSAEPHNVPSWDILDVLCQLTANLIDKMEKTPECCNGLAYRFGNKLYSRLYPSWECNAMFPGHPITPEEDHAMYGGGEPFDHKDYTPEE